MKIKLICCDVDGTLIKSDGSISRQNRSAIMNCIKEGVVFALASGRGYKGLQEVWEQLGVQGYSICYNGSCVYDGTKKCYDHGVEIQMLKAVISLMKQEQITAYFACDDGDYVEQSLYERAVQKKERWVVNAHCIKADEYESLLMQHRQVYKISLYMPDDLQAESYVRQCEQKQIQLMHADHGFYDVMVKGHEKVDGVKVLCKRLNINREEVLCIGDNENDSSMLSYAGIGVAMENAADGVKKYADIITSSNEHDGVFHALQSLVLVNY